MDQDGAERTDRVERRLVDTTDEGEIYLVLKVPEDGSAPDEANGTFVVIPAGSDEEHQVAGDQGAAYRALGELISRAD